jgi:hypothetical protein
MDFFSKTMTKEEFELRRLKECEAAWQAVFNLLLEIDPEFCHIPGVSGKECALRKIKALAQPRPPVL